jgi:hypothetical protein
MRAIHARRADASRHGESSGVTMRTIVIWLALTGAAWGTAPAPMLASADPPATMLADSGAARDRIIEAVQRRHNARVVRVTEISLDGRRVLELRLLSDQRVWNIRVDAESGRELQGSN